VGGDELSDCMLVELSGCSVEDGVCGCDLLPGLKMDCLRVTVVNIPLRGRLRGRVASRGNCRLEVRSGGATAKLTDEDVQICMTRRYCVR
jgi:hypothetical protein